MLNAPSTGSVYSKPIKRCFIAPKDYIIMTVDFQGLEDRIVANLSGDENKQAPFTYGVDGHCLNSYYYFKDEIEAILPREANEEIYTYIKRYHKEIENGNKALKKIRQKSKSCSFALAYLCFPPKLAKTAKISLEKAEEIHKAYHTSLYPKVSLLANNTVSEAKSKGYRHYGLGFKMYSSNPDKDNRTLHNCNGQFWSILTLLTINKLHKLIDKNNLQDDVKVISTIYDSIYLLVKDNIATIKWVNDTVIPIMLTDFIEDQVVKNEASFDIGYNWSSLVAISNNATGIEIAKARNKAKEIMND